MLAHSPRIVTDGMVLCLDAGNPRNFNLTAVEVLVVAGGGGGGANHAGGGGAGGLIYNSNFAVTPGTQLTVTVGDGGNKSTNYLYTAAGDGANSVFGSLIAIGGGGGGNRRDAGTAGLEFGRPGGSGGGGGGQGTNDTPTITGGLGTAGQGFDGGTASFHAGAGGGGAGGPGETTNGSNGSSSSTNFPGDGGPGLPFNISGTFTYYAGGGGGGGYGSGPYAGAGGIGGGGNGQIDGTQQVNGEANTGGGGGGSYGNGTAAGGAGGSGIIIVRYPGPQKAIGGTVTSVNGDTIHTFTTSGNFTPLVNTNGSAVLGLSDLSGNRNFGTTANSPTYSTANGGSLVFDGSDDYVSVIPINRLTTTTLDIWFNTSSVSNDTSIRQYLYTQQRNPPTLASYTYQERQGIQISGNILQFQYLDTTNNDGSIVSISTISANTWYNFVVTLDGTTPKMYLNGTQLSVTGNLSTPKSITVNQAFVGRRGDANGEDRFGGTIASVRDYNRALSAAEITQNFNATRSRYGI